MREAKLLDWVRRERETRVTGAPGDRAEEFIRDSLLEQVCIVAYSALRLTAIHAHDLPEHRRIVAEWLGGDVPDDASLEQLNSIIAAEMALREATLKELRDRALEDDFGTAD